MKTTSSKSKGWSSAHCHPLLFFQKCLDGKLYLLLTLIHRDIATKRMNRLGRRDGLISAHVTTANPSLNRRQILTYKDGPRGEKLNPLNAMLDYRRF